MRVPPPRLPAPMDVLRRLRPRRGRAPRPLRWAMRVALACAFAYGVLAAFGAPAEAQVIADMVNSIPLAFDNVRGMEDALRRIAWITFASLVFIEVAFALGNLWMDGNASLPNILGLLFRQGLMIGFFALLIQAGPDFCRSIILTMVQAGNDASQAIGGSRNMSPGDVIGIGSNMVGRIWGAMEWSPKSLVLAGCGAVIIWTFSEIVCAIIEVTIEGFLFASWSALMMGFGGSSYTREIAVAQLRLALGIGAKRFVLQCIVGLGENLINGWAAGMKAGRLDYVQCISMVVVSIVVYRLAQRLPQRAQDMINGSHTGGGYTGKAGLANAGKEAAEKAAKAGIATTAMGAAAVAAYDQARAQLEATGGGSGGGSGGGGSGGATGSSPGSGGQSGRSGGFGASLARGAKLAGMTASNLGQAATADFGRRMAGDRQAGQGYLGARMARIAAAEAERTRAQAPQPANTP